MLRLSALIHLVTKTLSVKLFNNCAQSDHSVLNFEAFTCHQRFRSILMRTILLWSEVLKYTYICQQMMSRV